MLMFCDAVRKCTVKAATPLLLGNSNTGWWVKCPTSMSYDIFTRPRWALGYVGGLAQARGRAQGPAGPRAESRGLPLA